MPFFGTASERTQEILLALALAGVGAIGMYRFGFAFTLGILAFLAAVLFAVQSANALAYGLLILLPLPSLGAAAGFDLPVGVEALNVLLIIAIVVLVLRGTHFWRLSSPPLMSALILLNILLFGLAWLRTYGSSDSLTDSLPLIVKPLIVITAAFAAVSLFGSRQGVAGVAIGFAVGLLLVDASVLLERVGLYSPAFVQEELVLPGLTAEGKPGGFLLHGNTAGLLIAVFTLPGYMLLKASGRSALGLGLLALAGPVLLVTLSRGSLITFAVVLLCFLLSERTQLGTIAIVSILVAVGVGGSIWTGSADVEIIESTFQSYQFDTNAQFSGRLEVWDTALDSLDTPRDVALGGGLDAFREASVSSSLGLALATHSVFLFALTTGGVIMLAGFLGLMLMLVLAPGTSGAPQRALRLAAVGTLIAGVSADATLFVTTSAWLWVLVALAYSREQRATGY